MLHEPEMISHEPVPVDICASISGHTVREGAAVRSLPGAVCQHISPCPTVHLARPHIVPRAVVADPEAAARRRLLRAVPARRSYRLVLVMHLAYWPRP